VGHHQAFLDPRRVADRFEIAGGQPRLGAFPGWLGARTLHLFFYLIHLFLYAGLGLWLTLNGTDVPTMYLYWLLGLLILYPLCLWYGQLKHRQPAHSILRFF